jgi:cytochrome P450
VQQTKPTKQNVPGPKGNILFGHAGDYSKDALKFEREMFERYGDVVAIRFANMKVFMMRHPDHVHQVLVSEASKFHKSPVYRMVLGRFLGEGLLTSEGSFWRRQRSMTQPAFHTKRIGSYGDVMVEYTDRLMDEYQPGAVRNINQDMMRLTLNIVSKTLFDAEMDANAGRVNEALTAVLHASNETMNSGFIIPQWVPIPRNRRMAKAVRELDAIINEIITERRKSNDDKGDLLSMLLQTEDADGERMTDKQVRDEAVTIFLAGHETTANALTWAWYLLSQHPEIEAKLHEEIDNVLAGRTPTLTDLRQLEYTEMVLKEAMRLYPPVPSIGRQAIEDVEIGDVHVEKDRIIMISPMVLHNDPRWWDNPNEFRPERFAKGSEEPRHKHAYLPFGGGPRVCIGNNFAIMEGVLVLAAMAQRYQMRFVADNPVIPNAAITLRPTHAMHMRLEARQPKAVSAALTAELEPVQA